MRELFFFLKLFIPYWRGMLLGLLLALLTLLAGVALLSLSGWFISATAFAGLSLATALKFDFFLPAAGVRFFALIRIGGRYGERIVNHNVTFKILAKLRVWLYRQVEPLAPAYLLKFRSADLLNRMVADVEALNNLFLRVLVPTVVAVLTIILIGVFVFVFSHWLAALIVVCLFASILFLPSLSRLLARRMGKQLVVERANLRVITVDIVQGLAELLLAGRLQQYFTEITAVDKHFVALQRKMARIEGLTSALYVLLLGISLLLVTLLAVRFSHQGLFSGAMIALIALGLMGAFEAIMPLPRAFQYLSETKAAGRRLTAMREELPAVTFPNASRVKPRDGRIGFEQANFTYSGSTEPLFQSLTLDIPSKQKLGIVGPTGSGKSTLLHLIARSFDVSSGRVCLGGVDVKHLAEKDLRASVTMITQRIHIFNATLRDNLLIACPQATDKKLLAVLEQVQLAEYVQHLHNGLDTWLGEAGAKLSGGQARRVALARAILHDAPVWLLDEPTEGLDFETEGALLQTLHALIQDKTVIMVSHRQAPLTIVDKEINIDELIK